MGVSLVITSWNSKELLKKNLPGVLAAFENRNNKIKEIIVVDDFSSDGSVAFLKESYPQVKVVEHRRNFGYGATCNSGVKNAAGELVAILNADVVPSKNFLVSALPHFDDNQVFSVTFNEGKFGPGKLVWKDGFLEIQPTSISQRTVSTDWPNGGSSVFRKSFWLKLGGMDSLFLPFYFEDVDLGLRARKAGYKCLWEPASKVVHEHQATINPQKFADYKHKKNISLIKERNFLLLTWKNLTRPSEFLNHLRGLLKRVFSHPGYLKVVSSASLRKIRSGFGHG